MEIPNGLKKMFPPAKKGNTEKTSTNKTAFILRAEGESKITLEEQCKKIFSKDPIVFRKREDFVPYVNAMISLLGATSTEEGLISNPLFYTGKSKETETITFFKDHKNSNHKIIISTNLRDTTLGTRKRAKNSPPLEKEASPFTLNVRKTKTIPTSVYIVFIPRENAAKLCRKYFAIQQNP